MACLSDKEQFGLTSHQCQINLAYPHISPASISILKIDSSTSPMAHLHAINCVYFVNSYWWIHTRQVLFTQLHMLTIEYYIYILKIGQYAPVEICLFFLLQLYAGYNATKANKISPPTLKSWFIILSSAFREKEDEFMPFHSIFWKFYFLELFAVFWYKVVNNGLIID